MSVDGGIQHGRVTVVVHRAESLVALGTNGTSNAFVAASIGQQVKNTPIVSNSTHPSFESTLIFESCPLPTILTLRVLHRAESGTEELLGSASLTLFSETAMTRRCVQLGHGGNVALSQKAREGCGSLEVSHEVVVAKPGTEPYQHRSSSVSDDVPSFLRDSGSLDNFTSSYAELLKGQSVPPPPSASVPQLGSVPPPPSASVPQLGSVPPPPSASVPQLGSVPPPPSASVPQLGSVPPPPSASVPQLGSVPPPPSASVPQLGSVPPPPSASVPQLGSVPPPPSASVPQLGSVPPPPSASVPQLGSVPPPPSASVPQLGSVPPPPSASVPQLGSVPPPPSASVPQLGSVPPPPSASVPQLGSVPPPPSASVPQLGSVPPPPSASVPQLGSVPPPPSASVPQLGSVPPPPSASVPQLGSVPPPPSASVPQLGSVPPPPSASVPQLGSVPPPPSASVPQLGSLLDNLPSPQKNISTSVTTTLTNYESLGHDKRQAPIPSCIKSTHEATVVDCADGVPQGNPKSSKKVRIATNITERPSSASKVIADAPKQNGRAMVSVDHGVRPSTSSPLRGARGGSPANILRSASRGRGGTCKATVSSGLAGARSSSSLSSSRSHGSQVIVLYQHPDVLLCAAAEGDVSIFQKLREADPQLSRGFEKIRDYSGRTILHIAAWHGHTHILKVLLQPIPVVPLLELRALRSINGNTILHSAAQGGHAEVVQWLRFCTSAVGLVGLRNTRGATATECAKEAGFASIALMLNESV
ncbi:C2 domain [Trypanosoma vivax]|uniref:C2 domain-containing protein n=1 Tax=Trypanosoma vivax (strain Y486) TaxID=1055687 RepID=G0TZ09_TRYVY|nr:C2 domain [Trypanosoma vivax]CCC49212.1 conserved hypothetical protein [Trypanosoma vivax Y486]